LCSCCEFSPSNGTSDAVAVVDAVENRLILSQMSSVSSVSVMSVLTILFAAAEGGLAAVTFAAK